MTFNFGVGRYRSNYKNAQLKLDRCLGGQFLVPNSIQRANRFCSQLGATHSQAFESWYANCPGFKGCCAVEPSRMQKDYKKIWLKGSYT